MLSCLLIVFPLFSWTTASSLTARIDKDGLNLATAIGREIAEEAIRTWNLHIDTDNVHARDFDWRTIVFPDTNISVADETIQLTTKGGVITTRCHFVIRADVLFFSVALAGDVDLSLANMNSDMKIVANNETGEVQLASYQAVINDVDIIDVHGGITVNGVNLLLNGPMGRLIRKTITDMVYSTVTSNIKKLNTWLFPVTKDKHKIFTIEYGVLKIKPAENALEATADIVFHYGQDQKCQAAFEPNMETSNTKMVSIGVSGAVAQCLLQASHYSRSLWYRVNTSDPEISSYFRTTCGFLRCIGRAFPEMAVKYPNKTVDITVFTSKDPEISVTSGVVSIIVYTTFNVTTNSTLLCQINVELDVTLQQPRIHNNHFHLLPTINCNKLTVVNSTVGYPNIIWRRFLPFVLRWSLNNEGIKLWRNGYNLTDYRHGSWHIGDATEINLLKGYASVGLEFSNKTVPIINWDKSQVGDLPIWLSISIFGLGICSSILVLISIVVFFVCLTLISLCRWWNAAKNQEDAVALLDLG